MNRFIRITIAALALAIGGTAVGATPAHAASAVTACFRFSDDGSVYANRPVQLQSATDGRWSTIRSGNTNASGCGTFSATPTNKWLRIRAAIVEGNSLIGQKVWEGVSPYRSNTGAGSANLGTGYLNIVTCWGEICRL